MTRNEHVATVLLAMALTTVILLIFAPVTYVMCFNTMLPPFGGGWSGCITSLHGQHGLD